MTDTDFNEADAPYRDKDAFIGIWNSMSPERRRYNVGIFVDILDRTPTEDEIEHGVPVRKNNNK